MNKLLILNCVLIDQCNNKVVCFQEVNIVTSIQFQRVLNHLREECIFNGLGRWGGGGVTQPSWCSLVVEQ